MPQLVKVSFSSWKRLRSTYAINQDYQEHHTTRSVYFELVVAEKDMAKAEAEGLEKTFKLVGQISTSNMICFDQNGKIKKYKSPEEILEEFYTLRLSYYQKRKVRIRSSLSRSYTYHRYSNTCATNWNGNTKGSPTRLDS